mmetsp:Transcript_72043/g.126967  ORF Transcript_72043/g.126967 Transcript_72043/m.126967 type:complete len:84 (-) Transcript_72043:375-626(-)
MSKGSIKGAFCTGKHSHTPEGPIYIPQWNTYCVANCHVMSTTFALYYRQVVSVCKPNLHYFAQHPCKPMTPNISSSSPFLSLT